MGQNSDVSKILYESGQYFNTAMSWYKVSYLSAPVTRNIYILICLAIIIAMGCLGLLMKNLYPDSAKVRMVVKTDKADDASIVIKNISSKYTHPTLSIAKVLISNYVEYREEYINPGLRALGYIEAKLQKVENISSRNVFKEFSAIQQTDQGFMALFRNNVKQKIKINSVEFDRSSTFKESLLDMVYPGRMAKSATVKFTIEKSGIDTRYIAIVAFDIKIPAKRNTDDEPDEALPAAKPASIAKKGREGAKNIKAYLTGTENIFNPNIEFKITKYKVSKLGN